MIKIFLGTIVGIFVGAVMAEVINRNNPELTKKIEERAKSTVNAFISAYKRGYGKLEKITD